MNAQTVSRDLDLLWPVFKTKVLRALAASKIIYPDIAIFEAWRSPARQQGLYEQGRSKPGKRVTAAKAWESWHNYGLAVDVALFKAGVWSWDFEPVKIAPYFQGEGLRWGGPGDAPHFDYHGGVLISVAEAIVKDQGVQRLWIEVKESVRP